VNNPKREIPHFVDSVRNDGFFLCGVATREHRLKPMLLRSSRLASSKKLPTFPKHHRTTLTLPLKLVTFSMVQNILLE
jgi:hypothetical protein